MNCSNKNECSCSNVNCVNYRKCCECVKRHRENGNLPACLRNLKKDDKDE